MSKKKETEDTQEEKQLPEKPKSKSSGLNLPVLIGIVAGIVLVTVALIIVLIKILILPSLNMPQQNGQAQATQAVKSEGTEDKSKDNEGYDDTKISEEDEKATLYQETGRITTNPKGSSSYVVINLGLNFIPREKEIKEELAKEPDKALTWKKVLAETKDHITTIMGNYSFEDLKQINRDTLKGTLLRDLQPIFKKEKIFLRNVLLQEFITTD